MTHDEDILDRWQGPLILVARAAVLIAIATMAIVMAGCLPPNPEPGPGPDPNPDPNPNPVVVGDWYIVISESADRTPGTAEALRVLQTSGKHFRVYDEDSGDAAGYLAAVSGVPRPALLILDETGKKLDARPLPQSADAMKALIGGDQ